MNKKRIFLAISLMLVFVLMMAIHQHVYLYLDDYLYGTYTQKGLSFFFSSHFNHYINFNGRALVHILVTLFLKFDVYAWRIFNPILITAVIYLMSKTSEFNGKRCDLGVLFVFSMFATLPISYAREVVFWLDGSFNYLFPAVCLILNFYLLLKLHKNNKEMPLLCILSFFSAMTEQSGAMLIGLISLHLMFAMFILKSKVSKTNIFMLIGSVFGWLTVILSPGSSSRVAWDGQSISFLNLSKVIKWILFNENTFVFILLLIISSAVLLLLTEIRNKSKIRILNFNIIAIFFAMFIVYICEFFKLMTLNDTVKLVFAFVFFICVGYALFLYSVSIKNVAPLAFFTVGIGAALMMLSVVNIEHRNVFMSLIVFIVPVSFCFLELPKILRIIAFAAIFVLAGKNYCGMYSGYALNASVNTYNLSQVKNAQTQELAQITLKPFADKRFAFASIAEYTPFISAFQDYYDIENTRVIFETEAGTNKLYLNRQEIQVIPPPEVFGKNASDAMIPVSQLKSIFGFDLSWQASTGTLTLKNEYGSAVFVSGDNAFELNGEKIAISSPVVIKQGRVLIPVSSFCEFMNCSYEIIKNYDVYSLEIKN